MHSKSLPNVFVELCFKFMLTGILGKRDREREREREKCSLEYLFIHTSVLIPSKCLKPAIDGISAVIVSNDRIFNLRFLYGFKKGNLIHFRLGRLSFFIFDSLW